MILYNALLSLPLNPINIFLPMEVSPPIESQVGFLTFGVPITPSTLAVDRKLKPTESEWLQNLRFLPSIEARNTKVFCLANIR